MGTAITTFELNGHPYIFALKKKKGLLRHGDTAWITRINDDGKGWKHIYIGPWSHDYVAVQSFQLRGHPYLFALKGNDKAYIFRIKDDGKGWTLVDGGNWNSNYVGTAITPFYLEDNPYVFALKGRPHNQAWIAQLHEPHMMKMDLSDHYPLKVKFRVVREE